MRLGLEKLGQPNRYFDLAVYAYPLQMAIKLGIPLIVYGENISYEYGGSLGENYSALNQINNEVVKPMSWNVYLKKYPSLSIKDFNPCIYPSTKEIKKAKLDPIYLSYFVPWSGYKNMEFARSRGFKTLDDTGEWERDGHIEGYSQIDTVGYLVNAYFKFLKFGFSHTTHAGSIWVRAGRLTRKEATKLVNKRDYKLDKKMLKDFLRFLDYPEEKFWAIVDKFANKEILEKRNGIWRLKKEVQ